MSNFRPINRDTGFLMPPSVDEWLPQRHLARFVVEVVASLDLRAMTGSYRGTGEAPYHPRLLLGILIYGYATGVFSSRKLERATYDSVAFRYIAANQHPDHDTIATFRRRFLPQIKARAKERHARERAEYEAKMAARDAKAAQTGKKSGGRVPQAGGGTAADRSG
jgi:transposase